MMFSCSQTYLFFLLPRFCFLAETIFLNKVHCESRIAYFPIAALLLTNYFIPMDNKVRQDLLNYDFHEKINISYSKKYKNILEYI